MIGTGPILRAVRERSGLTQEQAAGRLGVSLRCFQGWEQGSARPWPRNVIVLQEFLRAELDQGGRVT